MNPTQYSADFLLDVAVSANMPSSSSDNDLGHILFKARDGWKVYAFYDVGDFDYIEHFVAPDGEIIKPWEWEMGEYPYFNPEREKIILWRETASPPSEASPDVPSVNPLFQHALIMEVSRRLLMRDWLDGKGLLPPLCEERGVEIPYFRFPAEPVFSKSVIGSTPLDLESKPRISEKDIRSIAEEIVDALDDPNFYFGSHEVSLVADLLTRRLNNEGEAA